MGPCGLLVGPSGLLLGPSGLLFGPSGLLIGPFNPFAGVAQLLIFSLPACLFWLL